jgi:hypothetical protein
MTAGFNTALPEQLPQLVESKSTIVGFRSNGDPIWVQHPIIRTRDGNGWKETRVERSTK